MNGTGYLIMEEIGCVDSMMTIPECKGIFEHKVCAEIAFEYVTGEYKKKCPGGIWWLYLVEIELGEVYPAQKELMMVGINGKGEEVGHCDREYVNGSFIEGSV